MLEIEPTKVRKSARDNRLWLLLRRVTMLKCKGFKDLYVFVIWSIIGIDQF